jgi:hypothetical protein
MKDLEELTAIAMARIGEKYTSQKIKEIFGYSPKTNIQDTQLAYFHIVEKIPDRANYYRITPEAEWLTTWEQTHKIHPGKSTKPPESATNKDELFSDFMSRLIISLHIFRALEDLTEPKYEDVTLKDYNMKLAHTEVINNGAIAYMQWQEKVNNFILGPGENE